MTSFTDVIKFLNEVDSIRDYKMLAITYNLGLKQKALKNRFDVENLPIDTSKFSKIIYSILSKYVSGEYVARLKNDRFSWLPEFIQNSDDASCKIENYLNAYDWKKQYYGKIKIRDFKEFYTLFFDYPVRYSYQDILVQPSDKSIILCISHHGEIWIVSDNSSLISKLYIDFDSEGATVLRCYQ
jgi:hypothetical protein